MNDLLELCTWFLSSAWGFFTGVTIPGTQVTLAVVSAGLLLISVAFHLLSLVICFRVGGTGDSYGSRRSKHTKISEERKHDDK